MSTDTLNKIYMAGVKPSKIHIGHLLGFFNNTFKYDDMIFMIADYHKYFHSNLYSKQSIEINNLSKFINGSGFLYYKQSTYSSIYSDIFFVLSYYVKLNKLDKLFKINYDYSENNLGKYFYPFLMFIDVLIVSPCHVCVCIDQLHNIRYIKDMIEVFSKYFYNLDITFSVFDDKILSLTSSNKMSSSNSDDNNVYIDDDHNKIISLCKTAITQSYYPENLSDMNKNTLNLFNIMNIVSDVSHEELLSKYSNFNSFKSDLSVHLVNFVSKCRTNMIDGVEDELCIKNRVMFNYNNIMKHVKK